MRRPFAQVDVFTSDDGAGNPLAVVLDGAGLSGDEMQRFARWTNLSETTFVLPGDGEADYHVRIFTPTQELPFAGHPTLGTCHAWLEAGGRPRAGDRVVQRCGAGLVAVRRDGDRLAFAEPPLVRSGPVDEADVEAIAGMLGIPRGQIVDAAWADNGPGWRAVLLGSADEVLALRPGHVPWDVGVVGPHPPGSPVVWELRAFFPVGTSTVEDPVTGSLNASVARWLVDSGRATPPWVAAQGTAIGRAGRIHVDRDADGRLWVGGRSTTVIAGTADL